MAGKDGISQRLRYEILRRDNYTCGYCGARAPDVVLHVDHVIPKALGGSDDPSNLRTSCEDCNTGKASSAPDAAVVETVAAPWCGGVIGLVLSLLFLRTSIELL